MKLFGLSSTQEYAERLAAALGLPLAAHEEREFEDGEFKIRPLESVRGERVFACQTLASDDRQSVSDKLCRLLFFCGALRDSGAAHVTAITPYLAFGRKDRRTKPRDPIATSDIARLFEAVGVESIVTIDAHNVSAFENAFRGHKEHLEAASLFADHFAPLAAGAPKVVVLSPDAGGVKRAHAFAALLAERTKRGVDLAFMEKQRSAGEVTGELFAGDVANALVIVFDDMISTGTTIARASSACAARGAQAVHAAATHAVLAHGAAAALGNARLSSLVVTDSVGDLARRCAGLGALEVKVLETAPLLAGVLHRWVSDR
jgi:ribose-phosphate pyrophosphokinase